MSSMNDPWLKAPLARRLRRLELLEDQRSFPELDEAGVPKELQLSLVRSDGARNAVRRWIDRGQADMPTTTELLIVLDQMRLMPAEAAPLLGGLTKKDFGAALAACAFNAGRRLHADGRSRFARANVDSSVNYMLEAQRELLFALSTGYLSPADMTEAMGKYAVAVAFSSRWRKTGAAVLERALRYHSKSIDAGNNSPQAYEYLVELQAELFNATSDQAHLDRAIAVAKERGLELPLAELLLKRGVLRHSLGLPGSIPDLQQSSFLASEAKPHSGVTYVQKALVRSLALSAILSPCPLTAQQIRLPYGFLTDLPRVPLENWDGLRHIVLEALGPMREWLKDRARQPNLVAQQVLFAVLRDSVSRAGSMSVTDAELIVEVAAETMRRGGDRYLQFQYADALLARAEISSDPPLVSDAVEAANELIASYPLWPLPRVTLAKALTLSHVGGSATKSDEATDAWIAAAQSVVESPDYRRSDLGGRSSVFAIEDARGDLATALVFKPAANRADAEREAAHMKLLLAAVQGIAAEDRFGVPRSLAIVTLTDHGTIHVIEREVGQLLSDLDPGLAAHHLEDSLQLLALFHNGVGVADKGRSAWKKLKNELNLWSPTLFRSMEESDNFVAAMHESLPGDLPLVRKRDAHASNWMVDDAGRMVAVDLEAKSFLPVGYDVAQLVEDSAMLPATDTGFDRRRALMDLYLDDLDFGPDAELAKAGYGWFALLRATWIASSASASKALHAHARQLAQYLAAAPDQGAIRAPAEMLAAALRQSTAAEASSVNAGHRRRSKRMSKILRHQAPELGLQADDQGFVPVDDLAQVGGLSAAEILAVAAHPAEPRFEVQEGRIRALYGHSFPVPNLPELDVEPPETLFHGTSWGALDLIAAEGLRPMGRQKVHLTNNPTEALEVARRHSRAALLAVSTSDVESLRAVADAVWAADEILPEMLELRNPYTEIPTPPTWLTESGGSE
jgi:RNA:NAD 2'-phosphotransferase (TPT1/KptA family)